VERTGALLGQFRDLEQQRETASLGMWIFMMTEVMFFGGLFLTYTVYRAKYPLAFAQASRELDVLKGGINTAVLIASSFTMALAVWASQVGKRKLLVLFIALTMILGGVFLGIKYFEYAHKFEAHLVPGPNFQFPGTEGARAQIFFSLYFGMTGMHAVHMIIGEGILLFLLIFAWRGKYTTKYHTPVENVGLYWHFVDIVWIFLFPLLYLVDLHR
jgi:cytochrome c oxidase subunit 3